MVRGEQLLCTREPGNCKVVVRLSVTIGHVPKNISSVCSMFAWWYHSLSSDSLQVLLIFASLIFAVREESAKTTKLCSSNIWRYTVIIYTELYSLATRKGRSFAQTVPHSVTGWVWEPDYDPTSVSLLTT